jgi:DNA-directed RNA polymerase III subunit RPC8
MFLVFEIEAKVDCEPEKISSNFSESVMEIVEENFKGKVLKGQGVCVSVYDLDVRETLLKEGIFQALARVRIIVFKPFVGEVLVGKICDCNPEGIEVDLVFCSAFIPAAFLNETSSFDEIEGVFVWHYDENDLFYDRGEQIRFKVSAFVLPDEEGQKMELLGRVNEDGLGLVQWWTT